ncbi:vlf [Spodoptera litura granulovirus]|uniref:Vlf n=1 Tax=Spodoptera litura granulovirus TaxID=359919 RepID=A5IZU9_9BBAC|nr:vlf [Spodoptera litura granulovirus]ABQ52040.1 vlf [Spodoptera litura granulovirus]
MSLNTKTTIRSLRNYEVWRIVIKRNPLYPKTFEAAIERQKRGDEVQPVVNGKRNIWLPHKKDQEYKESTITEFQSIFLKVVYCLIDDKDLENYAFYDVDKELNSLLQPTEPIVELEDFIERLLETSSISKKRLQATINFYTNCMKLPRYYIPSNVELPKDKKMKKIKEMNKTIVLRDDFIEPISNYIDSELRYANCYTNTSLTRAAIAFNIIKGTGLRITNAYQITLKDLEQIYEKGEHKVLGLKTKHSRVDFNYVTCKDKKALKTAIDMYKKCPVDLLNKISSKSPTKFVDFKNLLDAVFGDTRDNEYKSTMIRNYVADTMLAKGLTLSKTSKMMNHKSIKATRFYINKYHPGPTIYSDSSDDEETIVSMG